VLSGQIRRGAGMALTAVLWSFDLRGFTERSDRLPSERMIALLFEAQAAEIRAHGGEILKFIGDGLLAIFPIAKTDAGAAGEGTAAGYRRSGDPQLAPLRRRLARYRTVRSKGL
jgi:adenylate cyclase